MNGVEVEAIRRRRETWCGVRQQRIGKKRGG